MRAEDLQLLVKISVSEIGPNSTKIIGSRIEIASLGRGAIAPRPRDAIYIRKLNDFGRVWTDFGDRYFDPKL